jgi:type VI secretion system protein ImpM
VEQALAASQALLGEAWPAAWLTAPVWRFALPPGACGPDPVLGVMLPSVDRVGRFYPLMAAMLFPGYAGTPLPAAGTAFLDAAEDAVRDAVSLDLDADMLMLRLAVAPAPSDPPLNGEDVAHWWTAGAPRVSPVTIVLAGLPPMPDHAAMLAGDADQGRACP